MQPGGIGMQKNTGCVDCSAWGTSRAGCGRMAGRSWTDGRTHPESFSAAEWQRGRLPAKAENMPARQVTARTYSAKESWSNMRSSRETTRTLSKAKPPRAFEPDPDFPNTEVSPGAVSLPCDQPEPYASRGTHQPQEKESYGNNLRRNEHPVPCSDGRGHREDQ